MINRFYKLINNKFSRFFNFIFFLRYLLAIFFVAIVFLISIPQFFDYKKKEEIIKVYLSKNYGLDVQKIGMIKFESLPVPRLQLKNVHANFYSDDVYIKTQKLTIYPKLSSIYNFQNFYLKKINLENSYLEADLKDIQLLFKNIFNSKNKIYFRNLDFQIVDNKKNIIVLKKVDYLNYGYKKNKAHGEIFKKRFKISFRDNFKNINFNLRDTGVSAILNIFNNVNDSSLNGSLKGEVLKSNFKLDFNYDNDSIQIKSFLFRDKKISFDSKGYLELKPYNKINLESEINSINIDTLKKVDVIKLLSFKNFIKRINGQNNIIFKSEKFSRDLIDNFNSKTKLTFGRLETIKEFSISESGFYCITNINFLDEFPILYFDCSINSNDKRDLLKKIEIDYKIKNESLTLNIKGNLNIIKKKINFDKIKMNDNYEANDADLRYFKSSFEEILFDKNFVNIFNLTKIKKFILELS